MKDLTTSSPLPKEVVEWGRINLLGERRVYEKDGKIYSGILFEGNIYYEQQIYPIKSIKND